MAENAVYLQPAFILQSRPYRESSVLLDAFTRDFGIVSVLAKGVRKEKSMVAGVLQPFSLLYLSYSDKHELKVLIHAEFAGSYSLQRLGLYCGFYVNELIQRFLHKHDPHPDLFSYYQDCLRALLESEHIEQALRYFELDLLEETGYGMQLDVEYRNGYAIGEKRRYNFLAGIGIVENPDGIISGETLKILSVKGALCEGQLVEAKQFLRKVLDLYLQDRPLKSREVLARIIRYL